MAQEFKPGEIVPQSGIYTITHDPAHADMPHEVTVIKGRRFPTCRPAHHLGPGCKEYWRLPFRLSERLRLGFHADRSGLPPVG